MKSSKMLFTQIGPKKILDICEPVSYTDFLYEVVDIIAWDTCHIGWVGLGRRLIKDQIKGSGSAEEEETPSTYQEMQEGFMEEVAYEWAGIEHTD